MKKGLIICAIVVVVIVETISLFGTKETEQMDEEQMTEIEQLSEEQVTEVEEIEYFDIVQFTEDVYTGAEFDLSLEEAKKVIGRELQMGDWNSNGGWQSLGEDSGLEVHSIESTTGIWGAQLGINPSSGNVVAIVLLTKFDVMDNESNINSFCTAFSKCLNEELSVETLEAAFVSICEQGGSIGGNGVLCAMGTYNDWQTLQVTAVNHRKEPEQASEEITTKEESTKMHGHIYK